ncbi:MAG: hypothetical protein EBV73_00625 [Rhodocyclales bacterium]|nr:hypothetical protein [Rhodocyclales bacterium]
MPPSTQRLITHAHRIRKFVAGLLCLVSLQSWAWNATGHRDVVIIAWSNLPAATQKTIGSLLKTQTLIPNLQNLSIEDAWMAAAIWPDELRDQAEPKGTRVPAPRSTQQWLTRARTGEGTRSWHFADRDVSKPFMQQRAHGLLEEAVAEQIRLLGDTTLSRQDRAVALAWVSHLVADAHQPLHTASRLDPLNPGQLDAGGNMVIVFDAGRRPPEPLSLHRWWDELPGHARPGTPRFEKEKARLLHQAEQISSPDLETPPLRWIEESFNIARDQVYPGLVPDPEKPGAFLIRQDYWLEGRDITRARIALAGRRLADIVARALKDLN